VQSSAHINTCNAPNGIKTDFDGVPDFRDLLQAAIQEDAANAGQVSMPVKLDFNEPS
jgi:hypothetical protein